MKTKLWVVLLSAFFCSSCSHDVNGLYTGGKDDSGEIKKEDFFDFATVQTKKLSINYGLKENPIVFYLFDSDPLKEVPDGSLVWKGLEPIYVASTDEQGMFSGNLQIPSYLKEVWLYTDYVGVESPVKLEYTSEGFHYDNDEYTAQKRKGMTRAALENGFIYPDGYGVLGTWDKDGLPSYLKETDKTQLPSGMNNRISGVFTKVSGKKILERYPSLVSNSKNDQQIIAPTKISLFWIKSGSGWESTICYYTYPTGTSVDLSKVKKTIVFPRCYSKSLLIAGDEVQLKYWNEETQAYQEEFPKGVSIGWILLGQAYSNGNINIIQRSVRYSDPLLNDDGKQRMVALVDDSDKHIIALGFEDNIDYDYSDVLFALNIEKTNAVRLDNLHSLPSVKNDSEQAMYSKGTVAYEDQWPAKGDYDMNDLVVNYHSQRIKNTNSYGADKGKIVKTLDTFIPVNDGATYQNGFGIQFDDLNKADIESISLTCDGVEQPVAWEDGQSKPVLILSDNMGANINKVFVLTIVYKKAQDESKLACPYNPFLIANSKNGRGAEVHLTGYLPTDKAMYRGTGEDLDRDMNNNPMYYVSRDNMPFAIHITGQYFDYPSERQSILVKYPEFRKWVESKGETNEDWFLK